MITISREAKKNWFLASFLIIPISLLCLFMIYPTVKLIYLSFTSWDGISASKDFNGLKNYIKLLVDSPDLWNTLKNNFTYFSIHLAMIPVEIFIAFLLNSKLKAVGFFKTTVFLPYIINGVAVAYMFSMFFSSEGGALNTFIQLLGFDPVNWLSNTSIVNYSLTSVSLWRFSGMHVILFLAAIKSVPQEILEAAEVDGANMFKQYIYIILPNILTIIELVLFLNIRGGLQVFDIPFVMTSGGPGRASSTFIMHTIETAFNFNSVGRASAMAVILMAMIITISGIQKKILGKGK